jgi:hypothetical protein
VFVKGLDETLYVNAAVVLPGAIAAALWVHGGSAPSASPVEGESLQVSAIEAL